jgi:transposase
LRARGREFLAGLELTDAARERVEVALEMIGALDRRLAPPGRDIRALARRRAGCRELIRHFGVGPVTATSIVCELGDVSRPPGSRKAVRCAGPGVGVHRPDQHSRPGKLTRQGSPQLRWALYEAAQSARKPQSPGHGDYLELKARGLSLTRATMTIARKLARRRFHGLRELGPAALEPARRIDLPACQIASAKPTSPR